MKQKLCCGYNVFLLAKVLVFMEIAFNLYLLGLLTHLIYYTFDGYDNDFGRCSVKVFSQIYSLLNTDFLFYKNYPMNFLTLAIILFGIIFIFLTPMFQCFECCGIKKRKLGLLMAYNVFICIWVVVVMGLTFLSVFLLSNCRREQDSSIIVW